MIPCNHASHDFFPSSSNSLSRFVSVDLGQIVMELKHLPADSGCSVCSYKHSLKSFSKSSSSKPECFAFLVFERYVLIIIQILHNLLILLGQYPNNSWTCIYCYLRASCLNRLTYIGRSVNIDITTLNMCKKT